MHAGSRCHRLLRVQIEGIYGAVRRNIRRIRGAEQETGIEHAAEIRLAQHAAAHGRTFGRSLDHGKKAGIAAVHPKDRHYGVLRDLHSLFFIDRFIHTIDLHIQALIRALLQRHQRTGAVWYQQIPVPRLRHAAKQRQHVYLGQGV